jgi:hypothetical protein
VVVGALELRQAAVGDLADEDVLETVGHLARDRRAALGEDEIAQHQAFEHGLDVELRGEMRERARPEHAANYGGTAKRTPLVRVETVDPGGDERLHRVGDALGGGVAFLFDEHADRLLDEQRVSARFFD